MTTDIAGEPSTQVAHFPAGNAIVELSASLNNFTNNASLLFKSILVAAPRDEDRQVPSCAFVYRNDEEYHAHSVYSAFLSMIFSLEQAHPASYDHGVDCGIHAQDCQERRGCFHSVTPSHEIKNRVGCNGAFVRWEEVLYIGVRCLRASAGPE